MKLKIKRLHTWASTPPEVPDYETPGSAGFDFRASIDRSIELGPGQRHTLPTGWAFEIPEGFEMQVRSRSGLASKHGIVAVLGTIDSDYRGEVQVILQNTSRINYTISNGERIAQGVIAPVLRVEFEVNTELSTTDRKGGFGSTGVK